MSLLTCFTPKRAWRGLCALLAAWALVAGVQAQTLRIAAASDLREALPELIAAFAPGATSASIETVLGSSGKLTQQIRQGAPFDVLMSADIAYPRALAQDGLAGSAVLPYARGRLVLWSMRTDARTLSLNALTQPEITHIAIANPRHAPYGARAEQALRAAGLWATLQPKLVLGENVAQAAQFVQSGHAQVGLIARAQALSPDLARLGGYTLVAQTLHAPLEQALVVTARAQTNPRAQDFARFMRSPSAQAVLLRHGFDRPEATSTPR